MPRLGFATEEALVFCFERGLSKSRENAMLLNVAKMEKSENWE